MPRYFVPITPAELQNKVTQAHSAFGGHFDRYNYPRLTPQVEKDLSKVEFDCENLDDSGNWRGLPVGYSTLSNGFTMLGLRAGGDWEVPIFFCIYWDGKQLRGYIPEDGNPWNKITKKAFGNDGKADVKALAKMYPEQWKLIKNDYEDEKNEETRLYLIGEQLMGLLDFDAPKIIADIQNRIVRRNA